MFERFKPSPWLPVDGNPSWNRFGLDELNIFNGGVGGDRIENILYRIKTLHLFDYIKGEPEKFVLLAGANDNNLKKPTPVDMMLNGMQQIVDAVKERFVDAEVHVIGLFPLNKADKSVVRRIREFNDGLSQFEGVTYHYFGDAFCDRRGFGKGGLYVDEVHFNETGYDIFAEKLKAIL